MCDVCRRPAMKGIFKTIARGFADNALILAEGEFYRVRQQKLNELAEPVGLTPLNAEDFIFERRGEHLVINGGAPVWIERSMTWDQVLSRLEVGGLAADEAHIIPAAIIEGCERIMVN